MTPQEKTAKTFMTLLRFSVLLNSPKRRNHISPKDTKFLRGLGKMKYHEIAGGIHFDELMKLKEKYL